MLDWLFKKAPHIYARVNPDHPHGGLDAFSESASSFDLFIRVDDMTLPRARLELCGKVLAWEKLSPGQMKDLQRGKLRFSHEQLKKVFR